MSSVGVESIERKKEKQLSAETETGQASSSSSHSSVRQLMSEKNRTKEGAQKHLTNHEVEKLLVYSLFDEIKTII